MAGSAGVPPPGPQIMGYPEEDADMGRLAQTEGLNDIQQEIVSTVRDYVDKEIIPYATELEHEDEFPEPIVEGMKEMGLFGLTIPEEYGGLGESLLTYALCGRGARPRLDERLRHHQHPLHRGVHDHAARYATSRRNASCPRWPPVRSAARSR